MKLQVECYSGYKAKERPDIFRIDGHEYRVEEVLDQWYGPGDARFRGQARFSVIHSPKHKFRIESMIIAP